MDWAQILVIILAVVLLLFLLLAIVLISLLIKVTKQIKSVTTSAQRTAEHLESAIGGITKVTSPLLLLRTILKQAKKFKKGK